MSAKQEPAPAASRAAPLAALLLGCSSVVYCMRNQMSSTLPKSAAYSCFGSLFELLESVAVLGSPAQWMVALLGLCLYPALSRTSRLACSINSGVGSSAPGTHEEAPRAPGPGSHCIQLLRDNKGTRSQSRPGVSGFFKRLRRLFSEGRAQARKLCGRNASLQSAMYGLSRKRSFCSRSSKSEDVLSSRLSMDSLLRGAQQNAGGGGGDNGRRGLLQRKASLGGSGPRWQPSMSRIASGQHLADMGPSDSSCSSATAGKRLEILSYNGFQAVDCISHETTDPAFQGVRQVVTDTHLLQFGAMIGEASAELALSQAGSPGAVGPEPASLFGPYDRTEAYRQGWELIVEEHKPGLHYWTWRRHLRRGLYMYKSKTVYETATTAQIVDFTNDMDFRRIWDESMAGQLAIPPPPLAAVVPSTSPSSSFSASSSSSLTEVAVASSNSSSSSGANAMMSLAEADAKSAGGRSAFMYARTKFPPPMASREYTYARRCWAKPDDGGCYCISRACAHPSPPQTGGRTVRVTDFISGFVIRSSKGVYDTANPAVEVVNVYFEDPCMPSGIVNMGIRRALWPMVQKAEAAFRDFLLTKVHGNLEQPALPRGVALDALGAAMGVEGAQAARAAAADADAASCMGGLAPEGPRRWRLPLASPYVLLYRGYVATWRSGRGAMLSLLSGLMSLWCGATGLCVGLMAATRLAMAALAVVAKAVAAATRKRWSAVVSAVGLAVGDKGGVHSRVTLTRVLWPWEVLVPLVARRADHGAGLGSRSGGDASLPRTPSTGSTSGDRLSSHPLPAGSAVCPKRLSFALQASTTGSTAATGGVVAESPRAPRRARGGFVRRCAVLTVKVAAKVAGAGLLLGRAARGVDASGGASLESGYATSRPAPEQQQGPGLKHAQQRRLLPAAEQRPCAR